MNYEEDDVESEESETQIFEMQDDPEEQWDLIQNDEPNPQLANLLSKSEAKPVASKQPASGMSDILKDAEKTLLEQRKKIGELEDSIKRLKGQEDNIDSQLETLQQKYIAKEKELNELTDPSDAKSPGDTLMGKINAAELKNDRLKRLTELYTDYSSGINDENKIYTAKINQLEDIFRNLENLLMTIDKNINEVDFGNAHDNITTERQNHRDSLVQMIKQLNEINTSEEKINEKIAQLEADLKS